MCIMVEQVFSMWIILAIWIMLPISITPNMPDGACQRWMDGYKRATNMGHTLSWPRHPVDIEPKYDQCFENSKLKQWLLVWMTNTCGCKCYDVHLLGGNVAHFFPRSMSQHFLLRWHGGRSYHTFRHAAEGDDRVRAQLLVKGMIIENRKPMDPREYLEKKVGVTDLAVLDSLKRPSTDASLEEMMVAYEALDGAQRKVAALQDANVKS